MAQAQYKGIFIIPLVFFLSILLHANYMGPALSGVRVSRQGVVGGSCLRVERERGSSVLIHQKGEDKYYTVY